MPLFLLGCSDHTNPANPSPAVPAGAPAPAAPGETAKATDIGATLATLTQAVRKYAIEHKRVPAALDEVVAAGYITELPPAPPGQKFVINPKAVQVILMRQ